MANREASAQAGASIFYSIPSNCSRDSRWLRPIDLVVAFEHDVFLVPAELVFKQRTIG
jgi:hypothetical protein